MGTTIKDVAKLANVSVGTASLAINGKYGVSEETREKVMEAVKKLDYRPNHHARSLITNRSNTIGLIVTDVTNPYFGMVIDYTQKAVERVGYNLLLGISSDKMSLEKKSVEYLIDRNIEGLLIVPTHDNERELDHLYTLKRMGIPFVFITTSYKGIDADCVMTDLAKGSYELTKYLIDCGHRSICFITGYRELLLSSLRVEGYKKAYRDSGLNIREEMIVESFPDYVNGYNAVQTLISNEVPDAIITVNDLVAMGALKCLKDQKIKVPERVSVAGYDDLLFSSIIETPLTTVRQPIKQICDTSLELLLNRINGQTDEPKRVYLQPELLIRKSTRGNEPINIMEVDSNETF